MTEKSPAELKSNLRKETLYSIVFILFLLSFFNYEMIGFGLADTVGLNVIPAPPATALNDGTGQIAITWNYSYENYKVRNYDLVIYRNSTLVLSKQYIINDMKNGEHSPLKGGYVWNVPKGLSEGIYTAELRVTTDGLGPVFGGVYWPFMIAKQQGTLIISKYMDLNGNGIRDPGEMGIAGGEFRIISPENFNYILVTDGDGNIMIPNAAVGIYRIIEIQEPGYNSTTARFMSVYLPANSTAMVKFGNRPVPLNESSKNKDYITNNYISDKNNVIYSPNLPNTNVISPQNLSNTSNPLNSHNLINIFILSVFVVVLSYGLASLYFKKTEGGKD
jgi:hypothetical protein